jgi:hypothetical protein
MIPFEELCAALDRFRSGQGDAPQAEMAASDPPTREHDMPPIGSHHQDDEPEMAAVYDDRSNELDIGDVLSDEEAPPKN